MILLMQIDMYGPAFLRFKKIYFHAVVLGQSYNLSLDCSLEYVQRNVIAK